MSNFTKIPELKWIAKLNASLLYLSNWDTQGHVYLESLQFMAVYKLKSLPTKKLLILNKEKLLGGSTTCATLTQMCVFVCFFLSKKGKYLKNKMLTIKKQKMAQYREFIYQVATFNLFSGVWKYHSWISENVYELQSLCKWKISIKD